MMIFNFKILLTWVTKYRNTDSPNWSQIIPVTMKRENKAIFHVVIILFWLCSYNTAFPSWLSVEKARRNLLKWYRLRNDPLFPSHRPRSDFQLILGMEWYSATELLYRISSPISRAIFSVFDPKFWEIFHGERGSAYIQLLNNFTPPACSQVSNEAEVIKHNKNNFWILVIHFHEIGGS